MAGLMLLLLSYCANMRPPGGGPRDVYPPTVTESEPPNYSTFFSANKIVLNFDEFVTVSDVSTEVFISPPLNKIPDIKTRGKSVIITIDEPLKDSTTYSIYFGKSIKDLNEGNPIENYNYVFSTGEKIDSLSVIGEVIDAFNLKPREDILVMLYEDNNDTIPFDSLPYLVKPSYLTRTNQQGFFVINNTKKGYYRLFALSDNNLSSTYDNAEEEIGYLDSLIHPEYLVSDIADSLFSDSTVTLAPDTADVLQKIERVEMLYDVGQDMYVAPVIDTTQESPLIPVYDSISEEIDENFYTLFLFAELPDTVQKLLEQDHPRKKVLRFIFRYPAWHVQFTPLTNVSENWMLEEWNTTRDTLRMYIMDETLDTISLLVHQDTLVFDTASYALNEPDLPQRKKDEREAQVLKVASNMKTPFPYYDTIELRMPYPVSKYDSAAFMLSEGDDTLQANMELFGAGQRMIRIIRPLKESTRYSIFFPDSVITDILGRSNDSTEFVFSTSQYDDYGLFTFNVHNSSQSDQLIIQLLTESEALVMESVLSPEGTFTWDFIKPGKYIVKAIGDLNHNKKWDTGDFLENKQPEPVVYYPTVIEVRAGWSFEEDWTVIFR